MILSGNGIEHALLALAAMHAGVPYAPLAPAYSLQAREYGDAAPDRDALRARPGVRRRGRASTSARSPRSCRRGRARDVGVGAGADPRDAVRRRSTRRVATAAVDDACARVGPDTIAKILFTSGSTGRPKGVVNTQRMLCSNQAMLASVFPFLAEEPPVLCDWLPWNHTAGGNHNFGIVLYNGGTLYVDEGRPVAGLFDATRAQPARGLGARRTSPCRAPTRCCCRTCARDAVLRERFFAKLKLFFYAAAGLTQRVFDELAGARGRDLRRGAALGHGHGRDRDGALRAVHRPRRRVGRLRRLPGPGPRAEARAGRREARGARARAERHARATGGTRGAHAGGLRRRRASTASATPCASSLPTTPRRASSSTGGWPRTSSSRPGPGCTSARCARGSSRTAGRLRAGRRDRGPRPRVRRRRCCSRTSRSAAACAPTSTRARRLRALLDDPARRPAASARCSRRSRPRARAAPPSSRAPSLLDAPPSIDARELTDKGSVSQKAVLATAPPGSRGSTRRLPRRA